MLVSCGFFYCSQACLFFGNLFCDVLCMSRGSVFSNTLRWPARFGAPNRAGFYFVATAAGPYCACMVTHSLPRVSPKGPGDFFNTRK